MFQDSKLDDSMFYYQLPALGAWNWEHLLFKKPARKVPPWLLKLRHKWAPGVPGVAGRTDPPWSGCLPVRLLGSQWAKERQACTTHCTSLFRRQASGPVSAEKNWKEKISRGERILRRGQASWSDRRNLKWIRAGGMSVAGEWEHRGGHGRMAPGKRKVES